MSELNISEIFDEEEEETDDEDEAADDAFPEKRQEKMADDDVDDDEGGIVVDVTLESRRDNSRRCIAEDPRFRLVTAEPIEHHVVDHFLRKYEENPVPLSSLTPQQRSQLLSKLGADIPLSFIADKTDDAFYWRRRYLNDFQPTRRCPRPHPKGVDPPDGCVSWKRAYFERYLSDKIKNYEPEEMDLDLLNKEIQLYGKYVTALVLDFLQVPIRRQPIGPTETAIEMERIALDSFERDHVDLSPYAPYLSNLTSLKVVYAVDECGMNFQWSFYHCTVQDCSNLMKLCVNLPKLTSLCIERSCISSTLLSVMRSAILKMVDLRELRLPHNLLNDDSARILGGILKENPRLVLLDLGDNLIKTEGAQVLAFALKVNSNLKFLNLRINMIKDTGLISLARALKINTTLEELNLGANGLTKYGAAELASCMPYIRGLQKLDLSANEFTEAGTLSLVQGLEGNTSLLELLIKGTGAHQDHEICIRKKLNENRRDKEKEMKLLAAIEHELEDNARIPSATCSYQSVGSKLSHSSADKTADLDGPRSNMEKKFKVKQRLNRMSKFCKN